MKTYADRILAIAFLFTAFSILFGCANIETTVPYTVDIQDKNAFAVDLVLCRTYASNYKPGLSTSSIANAGAQGGLGNLAGAAINPLVPLAGTLGAGGAETLREFGLLNDAQKRVLIKCMSVKGERSNAYMVLEP